MTAAVSQAQYKAEQQCSIWVRNLEKVLFAIPKVKNFPQLLRKIDTSGLWSAASYRTQNCLFLPQAWRPGLFALTTHSPRALPGGFVPGMQISFFSSCREQAAVEYSHLHDGVCVAVRCLLGHDALAGLGGV